MKYVYSQKYNDPELGRVSLRVLSSAVRFSARWKADGLHITIPPGTSLRQYESVLAEWKAKLLSIKPCEKSPIYYDGFSFSTDAWEFTIRAVKGWRPHYVGWERVADGPRVGYIIKVSDLDDLTSPTMQRTISKALMHVARLVGEKILLDEARAEADRLGLTHKIKSWSIGRGQRRLGCCKNSGAISLSAILMFFNAEYRRSTITHELAHLTHFDHSPKFYTLWEEYLGHSHKLYRPNPTAAPLVF